MFTKVIYNSLSNLYLIRNSHLSSSTLWDRISILHHRAGRFAWFIHGGRNGDLEWRHSGTETRGVGCSPSQTATIESHIHEVIIHSVSACGDSTSGFGKYVIVV